jgi:redox-sensitive bicupin YhaK (pirin superfamily)
MVTASIRYILDPHLQDLGGFVARRILPHEMQFMVGAFIFFDHLGPVTFPPGQGVDVRPHPHINLATVTYLFEGVLLHRDSLGSIQEIHPGEVNWMTAGRGIVHSERSPDSARQETSTLHGIQTWVALPDNQEETEPSFVHYPSDHLPTWESNGALIKVIAGQAYGHNSPVQVMSPILYLDIQLLPNAQLTLPSDYSERAIYSVTEGITVDGTALKQHQLAVLHTGASVEITATKAARCVVIGGDPVGDRQKWWNFVSSRPERIEQAKQDWQDERFDAVPGETEFIPLPSP